MVLDSRVDGRLVEDTIPDEPINAVIDLGQQLRHLRRVLRMAVRQRGSDDPTLGIHPDVQFLPANWLQVLGTAERSQVDQGIRHQLHAIVSLLDAFKAE